MPIFHGMPVETANKFRSGSPDAYGNPAERMKSGDDAPCRCCLRSVPNGDDMLVLAYRPFGQLQPYAETGPIFLCANACQPVHGQGLPNILTSSHYLLKAYSADERIIYGTGQITPVDEISDYADQLLAKDDVVFVDLRSAKNNCWQARLTASR